jgi:hypothetical protein
MRRRRSPRPSRSRRHDGVETGKHGPIQKPLSAAAVCGNLPPVTRRLRIMVPVLPAADQGLLCPGSTGSNSWSGIVQGTWEFSHLLEPFTG